LAITNKLELQIVIDALKKYAIRKDKNLTQLAKYVKIYASVSGGTVMIGGSIVNLKAKIRNITKIYLLRH